MVRHYQVAVLEIGGNVYCLDAGAAKHFRPFLIYNPDQDTALFSKTGDAFYNGGVAANKCIYSIWDGSAVSTHQAVSSLEQSPFSSASISAGKLSYTLKADYVGYGPRE